MKTIQKMYPGDCIFEIDYTMENIDLFDTRGKFVFPIEIFSFKKDKAAGNLSLVEYLNASVSVDIAGMVFYEENAERIAREMYDVAEAVNIDTFVACKKTIEKAFENCEVNEELENFKIEIHAAKEVYVDSSELAQGRQEIKVIKEKRDVLASTNQKKVEKEFLNSVLKMLDLEDVEEKAEKIIERQEEEEFLLNEKASRLLQEGRDYDDMTAADYEDDYDSYCEDDDEENYYE